jgi:hypothetical protein
MWTRRPLCCGGDRMPNRRPARRCARPEPG